jgi:uncharacterized protein
MTPVLGTSHSRQIAFVGPYGVGKTTAVCTASDSTVASTDVLSSALRVGVGRHLKPTTTVGLEVGEWHDADGTRVSLVGTPGQERFDAVRRSAMPRSFAVVLWLYGHHDLALLDAELWLDFIAAEVAPDKLTVAVTRLGHDGFNGSVEPFREVVHRMNGSIPVVAADPRSRGSVEEVLRAAVRRRSSRTVVA